MKDATLILSYHAWKQYCTRVEEEKPDILEETCREHVRRGNFTTNNELIEIDGVWWAHHVDGDRILLVTCYGKTTMDLPAAIKWAFKHNDRINLKDMVRVE